MTEEVKEHLQTSIYVKFHLGTHHVHTLLYPSCTCTMPGAVGLKNVGYSRVQCDSELAVILLLKFTRFLEVNRWQQQTL